MATAQRILKSKLVRGLLVGLVAAAIGVILFFTGVLDAAENTTWDVRVRALASPTEATEDVVLVMVEQSDLDEMLAVNGIGWPWPRSLYGFMVEFAREAGAASFTFDIILEDDFDSAPGDDELLRQAALSYGRVVYGAQLFRGPDEPWPESIPRPEFSIRSADDLRVSQEQVTFTQASFPSTAVMPENGILTFVNQRNDEDGVFRRYRMHSFHLEQPVPALALGPVMVTSGGSLTLALENDRAQLNGTQIPVDRDGKVLLRYTTPEGVDEQTGEPTLPRHRQISAFDLAVSGFQSQSGAQPILDPEDLTGKHLVLGLAASGLQDLRPTPLDPRAPGVTVHATMLDNLLSGEFMQDLPRLLAILLIVALTVAGALAASYASRPITEVLIFVGFLALAVGLGVAGYLLGFWVPVVTPLVAVFLAVAAANVANYATEGAQKRFIRGAFGQYLSPDVVSRVVDDPEQLRLGGEKRDLTMFFSDIQGFTTISEALEPEQLSGFLNKYLTALVKIIQDEGGTIDKFEGDAIIAFWNAPITYTDHPVRAVRAALKCQRALDSLRTEWMAPPPAGVGVPIYTRIGLNTGEVSVGNFGSETRFDYTALGDHMNLAARLEGSNKLFGTYLLISEFTQSLVADAFPSRELGRIGVVGRKEPLTVYEPMFSDDYERRRPLLEAYGAGLRAFYDGSFAQAVDQWERIAGEDAPAARLLVQARQMAALPPGERPADWDGVVRLTEK